MCLDIKDPHRKTIVPNVDSIQLKKSKNKNPPHGLLAVLVIRFETTKTASTLRRFSQFSHEIIGFPCCHLCL